MKQLFKLMIVPFLGLFLLVPFHATAGIIDTVTLNEGYDKGDLGRFVFPNLGDNSVYDNYTASISSEKEIIANGTYEAFCVENAWTTGENNLYTVLDIDSDLKDFFVDDSYYKKFFAAAWIAEKYYAANENKEAAQIAIWEIMFDTGYDYDIYSGSFRYVKESNSVDIETLNAAGDYLTTVSNTTFSDDFRTNWVLAVNPTVVEGGTISLKSSQNYIFRASAPVPEPATLLLLGTGLVGLAGVSRKKLKK